MTVQSQTWRQDYTSTGGTAYPYQFRILDESHLDVYAAGVLQTLNSDYTVDGVGDAVGGDVTFLVAPTAGVSVVIVRNVPLTQLTDFVQNDSGLAETREDVADKACMIDQQQQEVMDRTIRLPVTSGLSEIEFPVPGAGNYVRWNAAGLALEAVSAVNDSGSFLASGTGAVSRSVSSKLGEVLSAKDFGAVGDDATNDTTALQAWLDALAATYYGLGVLPYGIYRHTGLTLQAPADDEHIYVNLIGEAGALGSVLKYTGAGGTGLTIKNNNRFLLENIAIQDAGTGAVGLHITSRTGGGTNTGPACIRNVYVSGFTNNVLIGSADDAAASELLFINLEVVSGTNGVKVVGLNSLSLTFLKLNAYANTGSVLRYEGGGASNQNNPVAIYGGSMTNNGIMFDLQAPLCFRASDIYIEGTTGQLLDTIEPTNALPMLVELQNITCSISSGTVPHLYWPGTYIFRNVQGGGSPEVGDTFALQRYNIIIEGAGSAIPTYKAGAHSLVYVSRRPGGRSTANNQTVQALEEFVYLDGGTKRVLSTYPWEDGTNIATGLLTFPNGAKFPVVATGDLLAAGAQQDGLIVIEDAGAGDRNLIIYGGGQRFRIDGGANV